MFRAEQREMMNSPSPSQLSSFGSNFTSSYGQPTGVSNLGLPQRGMPSSQFQRNVTPTSLTPNFPLNLQQQPPQQQQQQQQQQQASQPPQGPVSPNSRNMFNLSQRSLLSQVPSVVGLGSQLKRATSNSSLAGGGFISSATSTISSGYGSGSFGRPDLIGREYGNITAERERRALERRAVADQTSLDLSEFPTLGNRIMPPNPVPTARNYVGMVSKPAQEPAPEFQIQPDEFPALPGAQNPQSSDSSRKTPTSTGGYDQALKENGDKVSNFSKRGIQTHPDGTISNIPRGMVTDQFGMVGLLTFIRAAETDPNLVALAPGIDLTTLGLNLNSPENLYSTFQSPWADAPCRPQDIDFHVPSEYLTNLFIREKLAQIKFNRYQDDLLFFLFYMNGGDVLQLAAAAELYSRDWRYHKEERVWITRAPGMEPVVKTGTYERGTYYYFDVQNWRKVPKEFHLEYDKLEERPHLPMSQNAVHPNQVLATH